MLEYRRPKNVVAVDVYHKTNDSLGARNGCVKDKVQVNSAFHPSRVDKSNTRFGWV